MRHSAGPAMARAVESEAQAVAASQAGLNTHISLVIWQHSVPPQKLSMLGLGVPEHLHKGAVPNCRFAAGLLTALRHVQLMSL